MLRSERGGKAVLPHITMLAVLTAAAVVFSGRLRVIGARQGRTGSDSLRLALNALDVGPTLHMSQLRDT